MRAVFNRQLQRSTTHPNWGPRRASLKCTTMVFPQTSAQSVCTDFRGTEMGDLRQLLRWQEAGTPLMHLTSQNSWPHWSRPQEVRWSPWLCQMAIQLMLGESIRITSLVFPCLTWAKTLEWMCQRKATWTLWAHPCSFVALSLFIASVPGNPTWKWHPPGLLNTRCSIAILQEWELVWVWLIYLLASPIRRRTGWSAALMLHVSHPSVNAE